MSEFTKGEWEYWKNEKYPFWYVGKKGTSRFLATVDNQANARLTAAAPDMYELLKSLSYRTSGMKDRYDVIPGIVSAWNRRDKS